MDEDMQQLVESIRERGLITPIILRKKGEDQYEIVSGHRRKKACELLGYKTIKAEVRDKESQPRESAREKLDALVKDTAAKVSIDKSKRTKAKTKGPEL